LSRAIPFLALLVLGALTAAIFLGAYYNFIYIDTDKDGLNDSDEIHFYQTDPNNPDSDGDGLLDGCEVLELKSDPLKQNPNLAYAIIDKDISLDVAKRLISLDSDEKMDNNEKGLIDYLFNITQAEVVSKEVLKFVLPQCKNVVTSALQHKVVDYLVKDGKVPVNASKALGYLSTFDGLTQRERIESGLDETSLKQLLILLSYPDQQFAQYAARQKLCIEDHELSQDEINLLANPSMENIVELRDSYLSLLEQTGDPTYVELVKEWKKLPDFADNITTTETTEDMVYLALLASNPEVKEAFELMIKGGTPDPRDFAYVVPNWNTELHVLYWLGKQNEFKGNDTLAQAIAMNNGLWVTMGDDQVREAVYKDTSDLLSFFRETNEIQKARGYYCLDDYPLEAKVALTWTGGSSVSHGTHGLLGPSDQCKHDYSQEQFTLHAYNWNTIKMNSLKKMRELMFENNWINNDPYITVRNLEEYFWFSGKSQHWEDGSWDKLIEVDGEIVPSRNFENVNFVFNCYLSTEKGIGVCGEELRMVDALCKSWGVATLPTAIYWKSNEWYNGHGHVIFFDPPSASWKAYDKQLYIYDRGSLVEGPIDMYTVKPPINQIHYIRTSNPPDDVAVPYPYQTREVNLSMYGFLIKNVPDGEKMELLREGIPKSEVKKVLLY